MDCSMSNSSCTGVRTGVNFPAVLHVEWSAQRACSVKMCAVIPFRDLPRSLEWLIDEAGHIHIRCCESLRQLHVGQAFSRCPGGRYTQQNQGPTSHHENTVTNEMAVVRTKTDVCTTCRNKGIHRRRLALGDSHMNGRHPVNILADSPIRRSSLQRGIRSHPRDSSPLPSVKALRPTRPRELTSTPFPRVELSLHRHCQNQERAGIKGTHPPPRGQRTLMSSPEAHAKCSGTRSRRPGSFVFAPLSNIMRWARGLEMQPGG